jgi:putative hydrolase of the HAD superfamily
MPSSDSSPILIAADCQWIVFDAVGTLIRPNPSVAVAYQSIASRYGSKITVENVGQRFNRAFDQSEISGFPDGPPDGLPWLSSHEIEVARWRWIVTQVVPDVVDPDRCFDDLWDHFSRSSSWSCFDDVRPALTMLREAGFRLAIASNFDSRLHTVCKGLEDLRPIERRYASSEIGFRKPAPEFFASLVEQCGCPADKILMVGDDFEHDVRGPKANGMKSILLDRSKQIATLATIRSLHDLIRQ